MIRDYFRRAIAEIDSIDDVRGRFVSLSATSFTCTVVNRARRLGTAHITVHGRTRHIGFGDISYSFQEQAAPSTANGVFTIKADEYELFLSSLMPGFGQDRERITPEAAAEGMWKEFLQQAGITYD